MKYIFTNGHILDGTKDMKVLDGHSVLVEDDKITGIVKGNISRVRNPVPLHGMGNFEQLNGILQIQRGVTGGKILSDTCRIQTQLFRKVKDVYPCELVFVACCPEQHYQKVALGDVICAECICRCTPCDAFRISPVDVVLICF